MNNGRRYSRETKQKAISLRKTGFTHREISEKLGCAFGTACSWTKGIVLTPKQKKDIQERRYKPSFTKERKGKLSELARVNLVPYQYKKKYTKTDLIQKILDFYENNGRIPLKREFNMYREYQQYFGSWNNAIQLAGLEPNQVIFSKKFIAKDKHICDSFAEKIVDDWLFYYCIKHERNFPYKNTKMTADFKVGNFLIEYFGLAGEIESYNLLIQKKRILARDKRMNLIEIYPKDLFSKDYKTFLRKIFKPLS